MQWRKHGVVWKPDGSLWWAQTHASGPTPLLLDNGILRLYVQCRDENNVGRVGYVDVDPHNPKQVLATTETPIFDIGDAGTFDDNGVFPTSAVRTPEGKVYLYYVGFELCHHICYRLLTGLAVSHDGGTTFRRHKATPILERTPEELFFRCGPFIMPSASGGYDMWYVSGNEWEAIDGKMMPVYTLRFLHSPNGVDWPGEGREVMSLDRATEHGFGRPYVVRRSENDYRMFYSIRKKNPRAYRLGYAVSKDSIHWERRDAEMGLDVSSGDWDSEAMEYAAPFMMDGKMWLFYNGNDFGGTGFGLAELTSNDF